MTHQGQIVSFEAGEGPTVQIGYVNPNGQRCLGTLRVAGNDSNAFAYKVECSQCGYVYGVNSGDTHHRKCPNCQGGKPGIRYWLRSDQVPFEGSQVDTDREGNGTPLLGFESAADWVQRTSGSMEAYPEFERVLEYGREFRAADRPCESDGR
jgi:rubredoxin